MPHLQDEGRTNGQLPLGPSDSTEQIMKEGQFLSQIAMWFPKQIKIH